jgi:N-acylneuraminate cytidylyltransferase
MSGVLALVPARGGSKGLPRKNLLQAGGRPLIAWTINAARGASAIERTIVSSDDDEIMAVARQHGGEVPFRRPAVLATDTATSVDVALHALDSLPGYEYLVLLQPTSPLRTALDIDAAFHQMIAQGAPSCVSVCPAEESPYWMYSCGADGCLTRLLAVPEGVSRRQDLPEVWVLNGALYIARCDWFRSQRGFVGPGTVAYKMTRERSLDIDTPKDFDAFKQLVELGECVP